MKHWWDVQLDSEVDKQQEINKTNQTNEKALKKSREDILKEKEEQKRIEAEEKEKRMIADEKKGFLTVGKNGKIVHPKKHLKDEETEENQQTQDKTQTQTPPPAPEKTNEKKQEQKESENKEGTDVSDKNEKKEIENKVAQPDSAPEPKQQQPQPQEQEPKKEEESKGKEEPKEAETKPQQQPKRSSQEETEQKLSNDDNTSQRHSPNQIVRPSSTRNQNATHVQPKKLEGNDQPSSKTVELSNNPEQAPEGEDSKRVNANRGWENRGLEKA
jgi:hypothetical protein